MVNEIKYKELEALISFPADFDESRKYPLVIYLHGAGTRKGGILKLKEGNVAYQHILTFQDKKGFVFAAPHCPAQDWNAIMQTVVEWVSELRTLPYVDTERVYLTGLSMGGYGTWELACIHPEWFAAIMPLCGGGCPGFALRLKNVPVRTFHGLLDKVVDPIESLEMAKAVNRRGGYAELILLPQHAHNCWDTVYTTEENYDWLLSHVLASPKEIENLTGADYG